MKEDCEKLAEDLFLLDMGELLPERKGPLDAHLAACPECAKKHAKFDRLKAVLTTPVGEEAKKAEQLVAKWPRMVADARAEAERRELSRRMLGLLVLLLLVAGAIVAAVLFGRTSDIRPPRPDGITNSDGGK